MAREMEPLIKVGGLNNEIPFCVINVVAQK